MQSPHDSEHVSPTPPHAVVGGDDEGEGVVGGDANDGEGEADGVGKYIVDGDGDGDAENDGDVENDGAAELELASPSDDITAL